MNKERLTILRDALLSIGNDRKFQDLTFRYDTLAERDNKDKELGECGTAACALGLCPLLFPDQLRIQWSGEDSRTGRIQYVERDISDAIDVARAFFGLSIKEALDIFGGQYLNDESAGYIPMRDVSPRQVAARIDELLQRQD
jgi:hypothetical protein